MRNPYRPSSAEKEKIGSLQQTAAASTDSIDIGDLDVDFS